MVDDSTKKLIGSMLPVVPPITCASAQIAMISPAKAMNAKMALTGVRRGGGTLPSQDGSSPSRPALKISRDWELAAEMSTPRVEVMPAKYPQTARKAATLWAIVRNGIAEAPTLPAL